MHGRTFLPIVLLVVLATLLGACSSDDSPTGAVSESSDESSAPTDEGEDKPLTIGVRDWKDGQAVPVDFTCDGDNRSPQLTLTAVPEDTRSMAVIVDDPDAPAAEPFVHWVVYNIETTDREVDAGMAKYTFGLNDLGTNDWFGPCPPEGDGVHNYRWRLFALDRDPDLPEGLDGRELENLVSDAILETALFTATYER